jgi:hypothetical protein
VRLARVRALVQSGVQRRSPRPEPGALDAAGRYTRGRAVGADARFLEEVKLLNESFSLARGPLSEILACVDI